jgi:hypothetical protein
LGKFSSSIGMDSQLSFSPSGAAKSGLLNLPNIRMKSIVGERRFLATFLSCCKKVCSGGRRPPWMVEGRITQEQLSRRGLKNAMHCGHVAISKRSAYLSGRRPCLISAAHAFSRSDFKMFAAKAAPTRSPDTQSPNKTLVLFPTLHLGSAADWVSLGKTGFLSTMRHCLDRRLRFYL